MKTRKYHIVYSWILLICFVAGQYMVYSHQHNIDGTTGKNHRLSKNLTQQTVKEKCSLCDVMHHTAMVKPGLLMFKPFNVTHSVYISRQYKFANIPLIFSSDRGPPALFSC